MKKQRHMVRLALVVVSILLAGAGCSGALQNNQNGSSPVNVERNGSAGKYELYDESKLAFADTGKVVLFFKAGWCSTCAILEADIWENLEAIPSNVTILRLNFDTEFDLRKKYGVTTQHTLVQVDREGTMIGKWVGSMTLADLLSRIE